LVNDNGAEEKAVPGWLWANQSERALNVSMAKNFREFTKNRGLVHFRSVNFGSDNVPWPSALVASIRDPIDHLD